MAESLSGTTTIGGVSVEIVGNLDKLRSAEAQAKTIAQSISATPATIQVNSSGMIAAGKSIGATISSGVSAGIVAGPSVSSIDQLLVQAKAAASNRASMVRREMHGAQIRASEQAIMAEAEIMAAEMRASTGAMIGNIASSAGEAVIEGAASAAEEAPHKMGILKQMKKGAKSLKFLKTGMMELAILAEFTPMLIETGEFAEMLVEDYRGGHVDPGKINKAATTLQKTIEEIPIIGGLAKKAHHLGESLSGAIYKFTGGDIAGFKIGNDYEYVHKIEKATEEQEKQIQRMEKKAERQKAFNEKIGQITESLDDETNNIESVDKSPTEKRLAALDRDKQKLLKTLESPEAHRKDGSYTDDAMDAIKAMDKRNSAAYVQVWKETEERITAAKEQSRIGQLKQSRKFDEAEIAQFELAAQQKLDKIKGTSDQELTERRAMEKLIEEDRQQLFARQAEQQDELQTNYIRQARMSNARISGNSYAEEQAIWEESERDRISKIESGFTRSAATDAFEAEKNARQQLRAKAVEENRIGLITSMAQSGLIMSGQSARAAVVGDVQSILKSSRDQIADMPELATDIKAAAIARIEAKKYGLTHMEGDTEAADFTTSNFFLGNANAARKRMAEKNTILDDLNKAENKVTEIPVGKTVEAGNKFLSDILVELKSLVAKTPSTPLAG